MNAWHVHYHMHRVGGDVGVPSNRADDPEEWRQAHHAALRNMHACQQEAQRWAAIADELEAGWDKALPGDTER